MVINKLMCIVSLTLEKTDFKNKLILIFFCKTNYHKSQYTSFVNETYTCYEYLTKYLSYNIFNLKSSIRFKILWFQSEFFFNFLCFSI